MVDSAMYIDKVYTLFDPFVCYVADGKGEVIATAVAEAQSLSDAT
jgi:hypothetical protein